MKFWLLLFYLTLHWVKSELILVIYYHHWFNSFYILFQTINCNMHFIFLFNGDNSHFVDERLHFIFNNRLGLVLIIELNEVVQVKYFWYLNINSIKVMILNTISLNDISHLVFTDHYQFFAWIKFHKKLVISNNSDHSLGPRAPIYIDFNKIILLEINIINLLIRGVFSNGPSKVTRLLPVRTIK
jgi:hypothetical protein